MVEKISVSDKAYKELINKSSKESIKQNRRVSIAEIIDRLLEVE